jgi:hypothetical protein
MRTEAIYSVFAGAKGSATIICIQPSCNIEGEPEGWQTAVPEPWGGWATETKQAEVWGSFIEDTGRAQVCPMGGCWHSEAGGLIRMNFSPHWSGNIVSFFWLILSWKWGQKERSWQLLTKSWSFWPISSEVAIDFSAGCYRGCGSEFCCRCGMPLSASLFHLSPRGQNLDSIAANMAESLTYNHHKFSPWKLCESTFLLPVFLNHQPQWNGVTRGSMF